MKSGWPIRRLISQRPISRRPIRQSPIRQRPIRQSPISRRLISHRPTRQNHRPTRHSLISRRPTRQSPISRSPTSHSQISHRQPDQRNSRPAAVPRRCATAVTPSEAAAVTRDAAILHRGAANQTALSIGKIDCRITDPSIRSDGHGETGMGGRISCCPVVPASMIPASPMVR